jgi:ATP-dependent exoDNAse (exonuclease V) beta subunit
LSRKIFKHTLVPKWDLSTEYVDGQRYYVLPDGLTKLKSVTTVLGEKLDKTALLEWKKRIGEEEANRISKIATRRGNAIHSIAERYVLNEERYYSSNEMPVNVDSFIPIKAALDEHVDNILGVELPLWSKALGCAGRTDLVAQYDGITSIIDFKTSKKFKKEEWIESYFLQSTIYSMMFERLYSISVPQVVIIITVDDEISPQIFVKERANYVDRAIEVLTS